MLKRTDGRLGHILLKLLNLPRFCKKVNISEKCQQCVHQEEIQIRADQFNQIYYKVLILNVE
jgi:hypothetical protein